MAEPDHPTVILVVEDEPFVRMVAVDLLERQGRVILEAGCAEEALAVIRTEGRIDLLFTDINMPICRLVNRIWLLVNIIWRLANIIWRLIDIFCSW